MRNDDRPTYKRKTGTGLAGRLRAVAAALFSALVLLLLLVNCARLRMTDPLAPVRMNTLKAQLVQDPDNEQLKAQIRDVDVHLRTDYTRETAFAVQGAYLLLGGLALFLLATRYANSLRGEQPNPKRFSTEDPRQRLRIAGRR